MFLKRNLELFEIDTHSTIFNETVNCFGLKAITFQMNGKIPLYVNSTRSTI